jgi:hypothetical protein
MMVIDVLKQGMYLRNILRISVIPLSGYNFRPRERHFARLDPSITKRTRGIASYMPTYGYIRRMAVLRNKGYNGEPEDGQESPEG